MEFLCERKPGLLHIGQCLFLSEEDLNDLPVFCNFCKSNQWKRRLGFDSFDSGTSVTGVLPTLIPVLFTAPLPQHTHYYYYYSLNPLPV